MKQDAIKTTKDVRIIDIILGAIILVLAGIVLVSPAFAAGLLLLWLSISLLVAGCEGIIVSAIGKGISRGQRVLRLIGGILALGLSIAVLAFPGAAIVSSVVLLSIALMVLGGLGIAKGITEKYMPSWARAMYVIVGGLSLILSGTIIAYPATGLLTLYSLIAAILIVNGVAYVIAGIAGVVYVPIGISLAGRRSTWESDAT